MASRSDRVTVDFADEELHAGRRERGAIQGSGYLRFRLKDVERLREEMLTQLAPADTGPVAEPRRPVRGRIVQDDDDT